MVCFNALKCWTRQQRDHKLMVGVCTLELVKRLRRKIRAELTKFKWKCFGKPKV